MPSRAAALPAARDTSTAVLASEHIHQSQEEFFDEFFRLARQGRTNAKGMPSLPVSARLGLAHDLYLPGPPVPLQRVAFRVLAGVGRLAGRG